MKLTVGSRQLARRLGIHDSFYDQQQLAKYLNAGPLVNCQLPTVLYIHNP
jgi:hypothetical protein